MKLDSPDGPDSTGTIQNLVDWAGAKLDACLNDPPSFTRVAEIMLAYGQYGGDL